MTLEVYTARMGYRGPDWLDVTLGGNRQRIEAGEGPHRGIGMAFAPSARLLSPHLAKRRGGELTDAEWTAYAAGYRAEMQASYRARRRAWDTLLAWPRVVVLCFCSGDPARCHRTLLAGFLEKLGATNHGEIADSRRETKTT